MGDNDFTMEAWVNFDSFPRQYDGIIGKWPYEYMLYRDNDKIYFAVGNAASAYDIVYSPTTIDTGTRYFIVAEHDAVNDRFGISINGEPMTYKPWT